VIVKKYLSKQKANYEFERLEARQLLSGLTFAAGALPSPTPAGALVMQGPTLSPPVSAFAEDQDIGSPALSGSTSYSNGTYTINGSGSDIGGSSDQFHFASNAWTADGSIVARVSSISNTDLNAKAGVMFRNGLAANAAFVGAFITPQNYVSLIARTTDGGAASSNSFFVSAGTRYIKLTRTGQQITAYSSIDAITWSQVGSTQTITLGASTRVGLAVTSRNTGALATGVFTNVSVLLPSGWSDNDIGSPGLTGSATVNPVTNRYTVLGGGAGIGATSDQFNFASRTTMGDGSVIARVDAQSESSALARAGVMIRSELTSGSAFASLTLSPTGTLQFSWRASTGGASSSTSLTGFSSPIWLKITQKSGMFSAYYSSDQNAWTQLGAAQAASMTSATAFAGVLATAGNNLAQNEATFSGVSVVLDDFAARDIGAPGANGSASYDPSSNTYLINASGADIGGASDQFQLVSQSYLGDGSAVAYVNSLTGTHASAKAGVMFRASADANSVFAGVFITPSSGVVFQWRSSTGGVTSQFTVAGVTAPVSLKIMRYSGNSFAAYYATNGLNFTLLGSAQAITMPANALAGAAATSHVDGTLCQASITGLSIAKNPPPGAGIFSAADELFLNDLESRTIKYFYSETNPATGLVPDGALANGGSNGSACSIAALGFGLSALTIADQRGFLTHAEAYNRALTTVNFLYNTAAQVNGFYYHFLNTTTGARSPGSELSSIDTAELIAGVVNVASYWPGTAAATQAMNIYNRVNWPWMQKTNGQYYGAWYPESGFSGGYSDFSEAVVLYLLGLASPTFPAARSSWSSWSRSPARSYGGYNYITAQGAALFTVQYPLGWYDLRGLTDSFGLNYHENAKTATLAQRQWMMDMSSTYSSWGANMWGLTASDSASGYAVWGGPPASGPINGTLVPTGPGGSLAFTPKYSVDALRYMQQTYGSAVYKKYGFVDAFNPQTSWYSSIVLGIDAGMMLLAAENARSSFVWDSFMTSSVARQSVAAAFSSVPPILLGASSRKLFPNSSVSDVALGLNDPSIEARVGGPTQLVLNFGTTVVKGTSFAVTLTDSLGNSNGTVSSSTVSGSTLTINITGVSDAKILKVNISDLRNYSNTAGGTYNLSIGVLLADATHDGKVNTLDFNVLAANFGAAATSDVQGDFNVDAVVDSVDFNHLLSNYGKTLGSPFAATVLAPLRVAANLFAGASKSVFAKNDDDPSDLLALL
jgi:hypothetical protein